MTTALPRVGPSPHGGGPAPSRIDAPRTYITARERQVLVLVANGHTNRSIGRELGLGEETVKTRVRKILGKLRANDRAHAAAVALRMGLIRLDEVVVPAGANAGYRDSA